MTETRKAILGIVICMAAGCGPKPEPPPPEPSGPEEVVITTAERPDLAEALMDQGRVGEAANHYREIIKDTPEDFQANLNLGIALSAMEDAGFRNERDYARAESYFRKAVQIRPDDPRPHFYLGKIEFDRKAYGAAIDHLSVAAGLDPSHEAAHELLGVSLTEVGSESAGEHALKQTLRMNPRNQAANLALGKIHERDDRNGLAMEHLERALDANPNLDMATYLLERVYYEEGLHEKAEAKCRHFLRYHPGDIQSLEILSWIYNLQGRTAEMLEAYDRLTDVKPDNTTYWSPIIQYHMENKEYGKAREVLEEALEYNPYYAYGNVQYGQVLADYGEKSLQSGKSDEALRLFSLALDHFRKAKIDDRYAGAADQLISQVETRIRDLTGR